MVNFQELFEKDPSTAALLEMHPIMHLLWQWKHKYGHLLSENDFKEFMNGCINIGNSIYEGFAKDERYIYERDIETLKLIRVNSGGKSV